MATGDVPVAKKFHCKVGIELDESGNLRNKEKEGYRV